MLIVYNTIGVTLILQKWKKPLPSSILAGIVRICLCLSSHNWCESSSQVVFGLQWHWSTTTGSYVVFTFVMGPNSCDIRDGKASFVDGKNTTHRLSLKNDSRLIVDADHGSSFWRGFVIWDGQRNLWKGIPWWHVAMQKPKPAAVIFGLWRQNQCRMQISWDVSAGRGKLSHHHHSIDAARTARISIIYGTGLLTVPVRQLNLPLNSSH
jgi:hypothetical protein